MKGRRRGTDTWQQVDWTIDRAKQLGVTGKANWKNQPQAMLVARATSELCRLIAADAILGIAGGYSTEELADGTGQELQVTVEPSQAPEKRTVTRRKPRKTAAPTEAPAQPEPEPEPEPEVEAVEAITPRQLTALNAALTNEVGNDRETKLAWLTHHLGRDIDTSKDVTKEEAGRLIDWFNTPAEPTLD